VTAPALAVLLLAAPDEIDEATRQATGRALEWLAAQQHADGSWGESKYPHSTAVTAFALLAFLSQGHVPGQGLYGPEVARGARFLVSAARADGYLVGSRGGNMYAHGMATLALAELWGMTGDDQILPVLEKATDLIVRCQSREGGWRYDPNPHGADISVTVMQVMALRAAKTSGMNVPDETMKNALRYISSCHDASSGGYTYQPGNRSPGFARTAAGITVLQMAGRYDAKEIARAVEFLEKKGDERQHYWYGQYYAAHAFTQVGGAKWEEWYGRAKRRLLAAQTSDGSFSGSGTDDGAGPSYQTAIAVIVLSVPMHYLPIFER
jgi:prenyltransferase beta subunit